jgi:hypothetical protein
MKHIEMTPYLRASTQAQMEFDDLFVLAKWNGGRASMKKLPNGKIEYKVGENLDSVAEYDSLDPSTSPWYVAQLETALLEAAGDYERRLNSNCDNNDNIAIKPEELIFTTPSKIVETPQPRELSIGLAEVVGGQ